MKAKDVSKLTKEEAVKKLAELNMSLLELERNSTKRRSVKKSIARVKTRLHILENAKGAKAEKVSAEKTR